MDLPGLLFFQFLDFSLPPSSQVEPSASQTDVMWRPTGSSIFSSGPASHRPSLSSRGDGRSYLISLSCPPLRSRETACCIPGRSSKDRRWPRSPRCASGSGPRSGRLSDPSPPGSAPHPRGSPDPRLRTPNNPLSNRSRRGRAGPAYLPASL